MGVDISFVSSDFKVDWDKLTVEAVEAPKILTEGVKFDTGKIRYDLVPPEALEEWVKVLTFGAQKYADRNWEKGMKWGRVFGALMRHSWSWWRGEDNDPETGLSHMAHVICCASFLLTYSKRKVGEDDRAIST